MNEEEEQMTEEVSNILNDTGTYNCIIDMFENKTGFKVDDDSDIFRDIEEFIVLKLIQSTS